MEKLITYENLELFAYSNDKLCKKPIKGIVINFMWLNFCRAIEADSGIALRCAEKGIIYFTPYVNPWAWMNKQAVEYTDECLNALMAHYELPADIPIVTTGRSMGGHQSITYTAYAKIPPIACAPICPVCDLPYHYTERPDLPKTLYSAFGTYDMPLNEALKTASPVHLVDKFPPVDFCIFHGDADTDVNIEKHSAAFVEKMKDKFNITLHRLEGMGHCQMTPEADAIFEKYMIDMILNNPSKSEK